MGKIKIKAPLWAENLSDEDFKKMVAMKLNIQNH